MISVQSIGDRPHVRLPSNCPWLTSRPMEFLLHNLLCWLGQYHIFDFVFQIGNCTILNHVKDQISHQGGVVAALIMLRLHLSLRITLSHPPSVRVT